MELGIKGNETHGDEIIKILEMLGGKNRHEMRGSIYNNYFYYIDDEYKDISYSYIGPDEIKGYKIFSLEDFLEKYPYKVGDKVNVWVNHEHFSGPRAELEEAEIKSMRWNSARCQIAYKMKDINREFYIEDIKGKVDDKTKTYEEDNYCETLEIKVLGYKVGDVVFTNHSGWIRITNKLWDCYAKEHVYEGIGVLNEQEYDNISHKDIINKMETDSVIENMKESITPSPYITANITDKNNCDIECPDGYEFYDENGNLIGNKVMMIPKKPAYPKTYAECCEVIGINRHDVEIDLPQPYQQKMFNLFKLLICRAAYWKIAGEQMGLGKSWEPDFSDDLSKYYISFYNNKVDKGVINYSNKILAFPTVEMRDTFYNNFKDLIEQCKELL